MKEFYTKSEAARALQISRQAVHQAVAKGRIAIDDDGMLAVDDLEQWRIARIKEAADTLHERQDVPNLMGDVRTPAIVAGDWNDGSIGGNVTIGR